MAPGRRFSFEATGRKIAAKGGGATNTREIDKRGADFARFLIDTNHDSENA